MSKKEKQCGIYILSSLIDDRHYIGSTKDLMGRKYSHLQALESGRHSNEYLQDFVDEHGINSIGFSVIEVVDERDLGTREQYWMDLSQPWADTGAGFNIAKTATRNDRKKVILEQPKTAPTEYLSIRLPSFLKEELKAIAKRKNVSLSTLVIKTLSDQIESFMVYK